MNKRLTKQLLSCLLVLAMLLSLIPAAAAKTAAGTATIYDLRVNDLEAPVGIDDPTPSFSWKMQSDAIGAAQTAYAITVSEGETAVWSTGWVENSDSTDIPYAGETALQASTEYTVTVQIKDQDGKETAPLSTTFEMGLLDENAFADAQWISYHHSYLSDVTTYTIDYDLMITKENSCISFSVKDLSDFAMWQINTESANGVRLRPHVRTGGTWNASFGAITLTGDMKDSAYFLNQKVHMRIAIDGLSATTYIGKTEDTMTEVSSCTLPRELPLWDVGFRGSGSEESAYDNLVVKDGAGNVLLSEDFDEMPVLMDLNTEAKTVEIVDGMFRIYSESKNNAGAVTVLTNEKNPDALPAYRKSFTPEKAVKSAKLYTSGLGVYESFLNGQRVGRLMDDGSVAYDELKPGYTQWNKRHLYNSYDVTWMLAEGENVLSAVVSSGWWSGPVVKNQGKNTAYLAKLILTYEDGTQKIINTDTTWKTAKAAPVQEGTGIFEGERYDATVDTAWMLPGYNDGAWGAPVVNTEFTGAVSAWVGVPIRVRADLERAAEEIYVYSGATGASTGYHGKVNIVRTYKDGDAITVNPGETLLVDFGQNFAGWEAFELQAEAGTTINVEHGEMLNDGNGATSRGNDGPEGSLYEANLRTATANTVYIASGAEQESYHPTHSFYGFRYIEITVDKPVTFTRITGQVVTSALEDTGWITTSDTAVNQLISCARWGMYSNYLSVPTDCPQRNERVGWTGDTQVFAESGCYLSNSKSFLEKWLQDLRDTQREDGAYMNGAPYGSYGSGYGAGAWADAGVLVPYILYRMYGDVDVIYDGWESMRLYMDSFLAPRGNAGAAATYGDWLALESNDAEMKQIMSVVYYAWDCLAMAEMAEAIGETETAAHYMALYEAQRLYFQSTYVNADGTLTRGEQTPCLLALYLDLLASEESVAAVTNQLVSNLERNGTKMMTGFLGTAVINMALSKIGRTDLAYALLLQHDYPSWLYSVDQGATTIWESWKGYTVSGGFASIGSGSLNHYSHGAVVAWMFRNMAGINYDVANPGFRHIILSPAPDQMMETVDASYESAYGTIVSNTCYVGEQWIYEAKIPANTTATIYVPVEKPETLTVNGKTPEALTLAADGLTYVGCENGIATFEAVAAPTFTFVSTITPERTVELTVGGDVSEAPVEAELTVNGETSVTKLPKTLTVGEGTEVTVKAVPMNYVDDVVSGWSKGEETVSDTDTVTFTVSGDETYTVNLTNVAPVNLAEGKTVTATAINATWAKENLTDGNFSKGWSSPKLGAASFDEVTAVIDLGAAAPVDHVRLYPRMISGYGVANCPVAYTIYTSDDNSSWTPVYSTTEGEVTNGYAPICIDLEKAVTARYVKLGVTAVNQSDEHDDYLVQLMEMGVYNLKETLHAVRVEAVSEGTDVVPMDLTVTVNGETASAKLPLDLYVKDGDSITVSADLLNPVDYTLKGWTVGETVVGEGTSVTYKPTGNDTLTLNVGWNGYNSLAQGKPVTATSVNNSWPASNLTDGKLSERSGVNGWSSPKQSNVTFPEITAVIDLEETMTFDRFHLYPRYITNKDYGVANWPVAYTLYVGDDNETWTPVYATTEGEVTNGYTPAVIQLDDVVTGRYVKFGATAINRQDDYKGKMVQVYELGVYLTIDLDQRAAEAVDAKIAAIGEVTLDSKAAIEEARAAYDALTADQQALVTKLPALEAAEAAYAALVKAEADKAAAAAVEALIAAIDVEDKTTIEAARAAYDGLTAEQQALVSNVAALEAAELYWNTVNSKVSLVLTGAETINAYDETVTYTLSAENMVNMTTAMLVLDLPEDHLTDPVVEAVGAGWYVISQVYENGKLTLVLGNNAGDNGSSTLAALTLKPTRTPGDVVVRVESAELAAYLGDGETFVSVDLEKASAATTIEHNIYDVNHDGVVNLLDLTRAQRFYGGANKEADVNADGTVNINDLILILNHYSDLFD